MARLLRAVYDPENDACRLTVEEEGDGLVPTRRTYRVDGDTYRAIGAPPAGTTLDGEMTSALAEGEGRLRAGQQAARSLAFGDVSRRALTRKLRAKGYGEEEATAAVDGLVARGYLDEEAQAYRFAVRAVRTKLWGRRRVLSALCEKGYPTALARAAIAAAEESGELDFAAARAELIARKTDEQTTPEELGRLLWRYGY